jgi:hypothetical protein
MVKNLPSVTVLPSHGAVIETDNLGRGVLAGVDVDFEVVGIGSIFTGSQLFTFIARRVSGPTVPVVEIPLAD